MAEGFDEEERGTQDIQLSDGPTIGVISCDDEGYETAGKKQLPTRAKSTVKEGRKVSGENTGNQCFYLLNENLFCTSVYFSRQN